MQERSTIIDMQYHVRMFTGVFNLEIAVVSSRFDHERIKGLICGGSQDRLSSEQPEDTRRQVADKMDMLNRTSVKAVNALQNPKKDTRRVHKG